MKKSKKRGISPLIATVLLIGFTISIAAVLMIWAGDYVKEKAEKEGLKGEAEAECATSVDIKFKDLVCGQNVELIIENQGSVDISGVRVRLIGDTSETPPPLAGIDKFSQQDYSIQPIENLKSVQIFPIIIKMNDEGKSLSLTCSGKMVERRC